MEPNITLMVTKRRERVANDPVVALQKQNAPFQKRWSQKPRKAMVLTGNIVKSLRVNPFAQLAGGLGLPGEWTTRDGRRFVVQSHCIMRMRAPEPVPEFLRACISVSARIDEYCASIRGNINRQRISMGVSTI